MTGLCQVDVIVSSDRAVGRTAIKREKTMTTFKMGRRALIATAVATLGFGTSAFADSHQVLDSIHFLVPGGAGGAASARDVEARERTGGQPHRHDGCPSQWFKST